ncbi:MAG: ATP-binding protein [Gammaproteobacteria bacterium]
MGSLFTKIFLSFWLVVLLLGAAMFAAEHYLGANVLDQTAERVDAHAETAAALLAEDGMPAVRRWLAMMARSERMPLLLLDAEGRPLADQPLPPRLREYLDKGFKPGAHRLRPGLFAVVRPVPDSRPPLYVAALIRPHSGHHLTAGTRFALALTVSGLVCLGLAALITRPIRRLRRAAQALAAGDLTVRVGYRGRDEVAALARDFDVMAARLRDLLESQRQLLRDVSHELRSPLARLRVALELARRKGDTATALDRIEREAERLEALIADVLSLTRLEAGATHLQRKPVALADLLQAIVQDAAFEAEAAGKAVHLEAGAAATVQGDPVLLRSAIENVVRNAIRHTAPQTTVEITLRTEGNEAIVEVLDQGPGVPEQELDRLFQPFARVGEARDRASGGYGLGLAISRRAAEAHGGCITAANAPEGGLRVTLRLPI